MSRASPSVGGNTRWTVADRRPLFGNAHSVAARTGAASTSAACRRPAAVSHPYASSRLSAVGGASRPPGSGRVSTGESMAFRCAAKSPAAASGRAARRRPDPGRAAPPLEARRRPAPRPYRTRRAQAAGFDFGSKARRPARRSVPLSSVATAAGSPGAGGARSARAARRRARSRPGQAPAPEAPAAEVRTGSLR